MTMLTIVAVLTMAMLTVRVLTMALRTMALLLLTMALLLLTMALQTMALLAAARPQVLWRGFVDENLLYAVGGNVELASSSSEYS